MITLFITGAQPSRLWSTLTSWQQESMLLRGSIHEVKRKNAVGKRLGQQNALKCHQLSLDATMLLIKKKKRGRRYFYSSDIHVCYSAKCVLY